MCNLYSATTNQKAIRALFRVNTDLTGNLPPLPGIYPDYAAPVVHIRKGERVLSMMRWGMPSSKKALFDATAKLADKLRAKGKPVDVDMLLRMEPDGGTTNIRNTSSKHWARWLGPENRCLVPFTSFSEFNKDAGRVIWFAFDESRPLTCFAGIKVGLDVGPESQGGRGHSGPFRLPHDRAERRRRPDPPQGHAGRSDHGGRAGRVASGALDGGVRAATTVAG